jgi:hypothetical protein
MVDGGVMVGGQRFADQGTKIVVELVVQRWGARWRLNGDGLWDRGGHWSGGNVVLSVWLLMLLLPSSGNGLQDPATGTSQPEG